MAKKKTKNSSNKKSIFGSCLMLIVAVLCGVSTLFSGIIFKTQNIISNGTTSYSEGFYNFIGNLFSTESTLINYPKVNSALNLREANSEAILKVFEICALIIIIAIAIMLVASILRLIIKKQKAVDTIYILSIVVGIMASLAFVITTIVANSIIVNQALITDTIYKITSVSTGVVYMLIAFAVSCIVYAFRKKV